MARYDYRCTTCETVYEVQHAMSEAQIETTCPNGHGGGVKLLPVFATARAGEAAAPAGGCGAGCACYPG
jgi:putative FmdB family regulatory protein